MIGKFSTLFKALFYLNPTNDMVLKPYYYEKNYIISVGGNPKIRI